MLQQPNSYEINRYTEDDYDVVDLIPSALLAVALDARSFLRDSPGAIAPGPAGGPALRLGTEADSMMEGFSLEGPLL